MRKIILIAVVTVVMLLSFGLYGCNKKTDLQLNTEYKEYMYNGNTGIFETSGRSLIFADNESFSMVFDYDVALTGPVQHFITEQTLLLNCDANSIGIVLATLQELSEEYADDEDLKYLTSAVQFLVNSTESVTEEIHYYKQYLYSSYGISGHRYVDTTTDIYGSDYNSLEGVYSVKGDYEGLVLLAYGNIYIEDPTNPVDNEYSYQVGDYTVANDFITMNFDREGEDPFTQVYLVADYIMPSDLSLNPNLSVSEVDEGDLDYEAWYADIEDQLDDLAGVKIKVLALQFYSTTSIN